MNYTQLCADIQDYVENSFSADQLATFVQQAEQRIYNAVQLPDLRKNVTGSCTSGNKYLACPEDYLASYSLAIVDGDGNYEYLLNKDVNFVRAAYPNPNDYGLPKYYAIFGSRLDNPDELSFILGPSPDDNYVAELHYYYYPESIVDAQATWLGDNFDSVLLYGSLVEAYTYMKGEQDMMALYDAKYKEALALAKRLGDGMERQDAYRSGQVRVPVQ